MLYLELILYSRVVSISTHVHFFMYIIHIFPEKCDWYFFTNNVVTIQVVLEESKSIIWNKNFHIVGWDKLVVFLLLYNPMLLFEKYVIGCATIREFTWILLYFYTYLLRLNKNLIKIFFYYPPISNEESGYNCSSPSMNFLAISFKSPTSFISWISSRGI